MGQLTDELNREISSGIQEANKTIEENLVVESSKDQTNEDSTKSRSLSPISEENKAEWITWLEEQLDRTQDADRVNLQTNRVFLTEEDDIDIARYVLEVFIDTLKMKKLTDINSL